jgi:hypothetical protein
MQMVAEHRELDETQAEPPAAHFEGAGDDVEAAPGAEIPDVPSYADRHVHRRRLVEARPGLVRRQRSQAVRLAAGAASFSSASR